MQNIDDRTKNQIIEQIREKAGSYVPEWRFEEENPDIGTAVALVYAEMFSKTLKHFNQTLLKNRIAFLNELDASLLPATPARGYVTFSLVNEEAGGVELPAGTVVNAQSEDEEIGVVSYRTVDDVYVTPARLSCIYQTSDRSDSIFKLWDGEEPLEELILFDRHENNLQSHEMYFCHGEALRIREEGWAELSFIQLGEDGERSASKELLRRLADSGCARFEYYTEDGYLAFEEQELKDGRLIFHKGAGQPEFAWTQVGEAEGYFIRCTVFDIEALERFTFNGMLLRTYGADIVPDSIYADGAESDKKHYFPFGERLTNFSEVYFGSDEALCKKGAAVELAFNLDFVKIPLDFNIENDPVKWDWIMKRSDFKPDPEYDITIGKVIWEYYNGVGWARLFSDERYADLFYPEGRMYGEYKKIRFICPEDIDSVTVNSCRSYYIRARVIKVNNFYKMKGAYISPVLEHTIFGYDYGSRPVAPRHLLAQNNLEMRDLSVSAGAEAEGKQPFLRLGEKRQTLYLGFDTPPLGGPLKFFFLLKDNMDRRNAALLWEYCDGSKWKELNLVDETVNLGKSGIVTLMGGHDFGRKSMFGREQYWMRITDTKDVYQQKNRPAALPAAEGIFLNTTKIINVDREATEYFRMEIYQENMRFSLQDDRIMTAEVYVEELSGLDEEQLGVLAGQGRLLAARDDAGVMTAAWIRWEEAEDFVDAGPEDRVYVLNRIEGYVVFGNGKQGRIPPASAVENIRIHYRRGGGEHANMPAGRVDQMNRETGFINSVRNPVALMGGCGIEPLSQALQRNAAMIRHQNRAVTARDYEELALSASRSIRRVRCFPGYDGEGKRRPGAVTLVVIQRDYESGQTQFNTVRENVESYLSDKISGDLLSGSGLYIIEPEFVRLDVRAELTVRDFNNVFQTKKQVLDRLNRFLDPFSGNYHGQGWEIGTLPGNIQIKNAISDTPGVTLVKNIYISAFTEKGGKKREVDLEDDRGGRYVLPAGGVHEVIIEVS